MSQVLQMVGGTHLSALKSSGSPGTYLPTLVHTIRSSRGSPLSARPSSCSTKQRAVSGPLGKACQEWTRHTAWSCQAAQVLPGGSYAARGCEIFTRSASPPA